MPIFQRQVISMGILQTSRSPVVNTNRLVQSNHNRLVLSNKYFGGQDESSKRSSQTKKVVWRRAGRGSGGKAAHSCAYLGIISCIKTSDKKLLHCYTA